ncbi:amino acid adenylation domain-containing protein [Streptomyces misionensis]|uniref:Amino acid adenylation domain-containing protein n=1 Tax=Streptomyces misionensis TaxID=67331 RepID=A0A1H4I9W3_9ACTN|nr:amino acid adenylation domain-containing protein [Streptomyces misionensis]
MHGCALVHELLDRAVTEHSDAPAVRDTEGGWTYAELDAAARAWTHRLVRSGVRPGDRVLVRIGNDRHFVALLFGTLRAGAVFVPLSTAMKRFHLERVVRDAEPALVLARGADAVELRELTHAPVLDLTALQQEVYADDGVAPPVAVCPDDLALLMYTSGSTATPKAVMSPHRAVVFAAAAIADRLGYGPDDVVLNVIPFSFDYGLYQIFLAVGAGARLVLSGTDEHVGLMTVLHEARITVFPVVPSLAHMLLRLAARDRRPAPAVRLFTSTGAALAPQVVAKLRALFPGAAVAPMYGTTECKRITVLAPGEVPPRPESVGRPLAGTQVLVVDEHGRPLPTGETGEIVVRGPHVMAGYWRAPEPTRDRFRTDPATGEVALHTGDFGYLDEHGHLYVSGRRDDLFKRKGVRMSALEIEAAALDVPGVRAAAVLPPTPTADVVLFVAGEQAPAEVLRALGQRLEAAKVPHVCHVLPELPLTPNGKTDKKRLAELVGATTPAA